MQYKALPWLRVCTFGLGAQSANIWRRDWNVRNAIIEVLVLRNPRTLSDPPWAGNELGHDIFVSHFIKLRNCHAWARTERVYTTNGFLRDKLIMNLKL